MPFVSVVFGLLLGGLGVYGYSAPPDPGKDRSITALIPAFEGGLLILLGLVALNESLLKHAMHGAALVGVLGLIGGAVRFGQVMAAGGTLDGLKAQVTGGMALLSLAFVALCVNSFIQARRRKAAEAASGPA